MSDEQKGLEGRRARMHLAFRARSAIANANGASIGKTDEKEIRRFQMEQIEQQSFTLRRSTKQVVSTSYRSPLITSRLHGIYLFQYFKLIWLVRLELFRRKHDSGSE
jgi:hypothetical protein